MTPALTTKVTRDHRPPCTWVEFSISGRETGQCSSPNRRGQRGPQQVSAAQESRDPQGARNEHYQGHTSAQGLGVGPINPRQTQESLNLELRGH